MSYDRLEQIAFNAGAAATGERIEALQRERDNLYRCVKFYADGNHCELPDWEPPDEPNWLCPPLEIEGEEPQVGWSPGQPPPKKLTVAISPPWMVEDGGIARFVLAGGDLPAGWDDDDGEYESMRLPEGAKPLDPPPAEGTENG